tara:strand:- start:843 stop:1331 length:489 start_codon:yes stop_codon:yes gene_type:complete
MKKLLLTTVTILTTICASAQFMALTTLNKVDGIDPIEPSSTEVYDGEVCPTTDTDDSYNITDKIGIGYQVNEKLMVGATKDGDENYELIGRYTIKESIWATCVYNYEKDSESSMTDNLEVGLGYSFQLWKGLYIDPNYIMPLKENAEGNREGSFNLSFSYKF